MDLKILGVILLYYMLLTSFFLMGGSYLADSSFTNTINASNVTTADLPEGGGFLGSGISFGRFFGLVTIGVGLPSDTPAFFSTLFVIIQTCILLFLLGFVVSAVWNG